MLDGGQTADALLALIGEAHFGYAQTGGNYLKLSLSLSKCVSGGVAFEPATSIKAWMERADHALYEAKCRGRDQTVYYDRSDTGVVA